jgi:hypothetical protein
LKDELKDVKEVNSDAAAAAYIEAFALKVFNNADAEDRLGGSNRCASFIPKLNLALCLWVHLQVDGKEVPCGGQLSRSP